MTRELYTQAELEAYLDESLSPQEMASVESVLRNSPELVRQLAAIHSRRDHGVHSVGEIWRRNRVSCPPREQLGSYLLGVLEPGLADHIRFHLETIHCRFCAANLADLQRQQADSRAAAVRRQRYFQSSAGYLKSEE